MLLSDERDLDDDMAYNMVVVTGESNGVLTTGEAGSPVRAVARDEEAIARQGFEVPYFYSSQYITSVLQAQLVADAFLIRAPRRR